MAKSRSRLGSQVPATPPIPPTPAVQTGPKKADEAKDLTELAQYMQDTYSIRVDTASLSSLDFESVKIAAQGIEDIVKEFPQAASFISVLQGRNLSALTLASASFNGTISLSQRHFQDRAGLQKTYNWDVQNGGSPAGTTSDHIVTHEAGHLLERALIGKDITGTDFAARLQAADAWNKHTYSTKVISEACKAAKKTAAGKGLSNAQLVHSISGYASTNRAEALAECVADYTANGSNAKPLSIEVWRILKRELG